MVYEKVYADIINGTITSNDILTEGALVSELAVSKSPVREALILLCEEEVLESIPRMGYKVVQVTPAQVQILAEARAALEPFMLRKAWDIMEECELLQLEESIERCKADEKVNTSVQDNWRRNIAFHMQLASFAKNDYLLSMLERTLRTCARAATQYYLHTHGIPQGEAGMHDVLVKAIRARDLDTAMDILRADIRQIV